MAEAKNVLRIPGEVRGHGIRPGRVQGVVCGGGCSELWSEVRKCLSWVPIIGVILLF